MYIRAADPIAWPEAGLGDLCALGEPAHLALGPTRVIVVAYYHLQKMAIAIPIFSASFSQKLLQLKKLY